MATTALVRVLELLCNTDTSARVPICWRQSSILRPLQDLGVNTTSVCVIYSGSQTFSDIAPGEVYNASISITHERLTDLVKAMVHRQLI